MKVLIPPPLHSYTGGISVAQEEGATLAEMLARLEARYPGIRFRIIDEQERIRPHIRFFINAKMAGGIEEPVGPADEVRIICALSGG